MTIRIDRISKSLDGQRILDEFSAEIASRGVTCIMGRSGVGKTTLLNILLGLLPADSGSITGLDGKRVSAVFQEDRLLPWFSALENLHVAQPREQPDRAAALLERFGLDSEAQHKRIDQLSGGMQRRVAIARAMIVEPDLLVMDEPFRSLDSELKLQVMQLVKEYSRDKAVLLVSHEQEDARFLEATIYRLGERTDEETTKTK